MKKLMLGLVLSIMVLTGCSTSYDVNNMATIQDVKIAVIKDSRNATVVNYTKSGVTSDNYYISDEVISQIKKIKTLEGLTESDETLYDVVTDGQSIFMISLSKNRKE